LILRVLKIQVKITEGIHHKKHQRAMCQHF